MKWYISICFLCMALLAFTSTSQATIIIPATLQSMTEFSDIIVIGTVKNQNSYWEGKKIYTDIVIEVQEFVKNAQGAPTSEITLKMLGGTVDDLTLAVDMTPVFKVGEKTMLFLEKKANGTYAPFGLSYGVYKITFDQEQQQELVNGLYFQYSEYVDLKTKGTISVSEEMMLKAEEPQRKYGQGFSPFLQRVKRFVK